MMPMTMLLVFIFGICVVITYFIVWTKRSYPFYALKKIKRAKKRRNTELLRLEGAGILDDLRKHPLLFINDERENNRRKQEKLQWKRGRRSDLLLENWVTSDSTKIFYLRTIRKLHFNVIRTCLAQFLSQRMLLLHALLNIDNKRHQILEIYDFIEKYVLSYLCEILDPMEVTEEYALKNLVQITLEEDY